MNGKKDEKKNTHNLKSFERDNCLLLLWLCMFLCLYERTSLTRRVSQNSTFSHSLFHCCFHLPCVFFFIWFCRTNNCQFKRADFRKFWKKKSFLNALNWFVSSTKAARIDSTFAFWANSGLRANSTSKSRKMKLKRLNSHFLFAIPQMYWERQWKCAKQIFFSVAFIEPARLRFVYGFGFALLCFGIL